MAKATVTTISAVLALLGVVTLLGLGGLDILGFLPFEVPEALLIMILVGSIVLLFETRDDSGRIAIYQVLLSIGGIILSGSALFLKTDVPPAVSAIVSILVAIQLVKEIFTK